MGNAVRFRKPTRRKSPLKIFFTTILVITILAVAGYFAYGYIRDRFFSAPKEPEKPEIIYIIEEEDPPPPPPVVEVQENPQPEEETEVQPVVEEIPTEEAPVVPETAETIPTEEAVNEVVN